jgi:hypothetical protein
MGASPSTKRWMVSHSGYCGGEKSIRKSIIAPGDQNAAMPADEWLDLNLLCRVEVTSEDPGHPIESAFISNRGPGWLAVNTADKIT